MFVRPNILTIAGSDSGGGAGIQADLKTITVLSAYAMSVITALTAQNGAGVSGIHAVPPDFVREQYETVRKGFAIHAAKTGMLCNSAVMHAIAPLLAERDFQLVVDPVCVSQSGHKLLEDDALETLRKVIVPLADLLTPNIPEAAALTGRSVTNLEDIAAAAKTLHDMGAKNVLIKGGHFESFGNEETMIDWLSTGDGALHPIAHKRVHTPNNHGTGCTLSAAIATFLGFKDDLPTAVKNAQNFLVRGLAESFNPGIGAGPVNFVAGAMRFVERN